MLKDIDPIFKTDSKEDFINYLESDRYTVFKQSQEKHREKYNVEKYFFPGFCNICESETEFLVDLKSGGVLKDKIYTHNFRERFACSKCNYNSRQRLNISILKEILKKSSNAQVYLMEQITDYFKFVSKYFENSKIIGSEYLSDKLASGTIRDGIRHENCEDLSFLDNSIDLIVSNEVFEHVPNPNKAFKECYRVLKDKGEFFFTIPFFPHENISVSRAYIYKSFVRRIMLLLPPTLIKLLEAILGSDFYQDKIVHIKPAEYHGNPLSENGSLVFTDFGWDVLSELKKVGFKKVRIEIYQSFELGNFQIDYIFRCNK